MSQIRKGKWLLMRGLLALSIASLLLSSGCAVLWLGAGGAGGYLIRKGEEDGNGSTKKRSGSEPRAVNENY